MHPAERVARHQPQHERLRRNPAWEPAKAGDLAQRFSSLLQFKMAQILEHNGWHGHAQCGREILNCHGLLLVGVSEEIYQALRQILGAARFIKLDRKFFSVGHLAKIGEVRTHDRNAVGTGEVGDAAAPGR